jgi:hypothetical protein
LSDAAVDSRLDCEPHAFRLFFVTSPPRWVHIPFIGHPI